MNRSFLQLMLISVFIVSAYAWPVTTKQAGELSLSVLPLQKTGEHQEQEIVQDPVEVKQEAPANEQIQVKSTPSEVEGKSEIHTEKIEDVSFQQQEKKKEEQPIIQEHIEKLNLPEKEMLETVSISGKSSEPSLSTHVAKKGQSSSVQEANVEPKVETKSSDSVNLSEDTPILKKVEPEEPKAAEPEQLPEIIEPIVEVKPTEISHAQEKAKSTPSERQQTKVDDKTDRVTREAEEAAKKLQQQKEEENKEAAKILKSKEAELAKESSQQDLTEQAKVKNVDEKDASQLSESPIIKDDDNRQHSSKSGVIEEKIAETSGADSSLPLSKSHETEKEINIPAAESTAKIEKASQDKFQQNIKEVKTVTKDAKLDEPEPTKAEELPEPQEIKNEMTTTTLNEKLKKSTEKSSKESAEDDSKESDSDEKSTEEKTENSSEESNSSRSDSSKSDKLPTSS